MNDKLNDEILFEKIFRCLCRVLKNRKIYHRFRCFVGQNIRLNCIEKYVTHGNGSAFCFVYSQKEMLTLLTKHNHAKIDFDNENYVKSRVTFLLNQILRHSVEKFVGDLKKVDDIGRETFNMVCKDIYGDDFVEETIESLDDISLTENINQLLLKKILEETGIKIEDLPLF